MNTGRKSDFFAGTYIHCIFDPPAIFPVIYDQDKLGQKLTLVDNFKWKHSDKRVMIRKYIQKIIVVCNVKYYTKGGKFQLPFCFNFNVFGFGGRGGGQSSFFCLSFAVSRRKHSKVKVFRKKNNLSLIYLFVSAMCKCLQALKLVQRFK